MAELMYKIGNEEAPDIRIIRKELPERLAAIVARSIAKKPESRYQDGEQFAADLRGVMNEMAGLPVREPEPAVLAGAQPAASTLSEKTVVFASAAAPAPAAFEATVVGLPTAPADEANYEATQKLNLDGSVPVKSPGDETDLTI
jgi:serine/threonine-protein kinase